jgi:hypothetical protein
LYFLFSGILGLANRWVLLAETMPWQELEEAYAPQFSDNVGALAKPVRLACRSLYLKQHLGPKDEETVLNIQDNYCIQLFLGLAGCACKVLFDPSAMVHYRKA